MNEDAIAAQVAQNIQKEEHIPAPVAPEEPQPSAFESNVELNNPAISLQLVDYFSVGRIDRFNEETQRQLRAVYRWAAEQLQSTELDKILPLIRQVEMEIGSSFKEDRLARLAKWVNLQKQSEVLRAQMGALYG